MLSIKVVLSGIAFLAACLANLVLVYFLLASPPIHLFYEGVPAAGPSSVYVPGTRDDANVTWIFNRHCLDISTY